MKTKLLLLLIGLSLTLTSCDKSIKGKVVDNFKKPVNGLKVSIKNSAFESITDKEGDFKIDYVAGKIELIFEKENYIPVSKELDISERAQYPIGIINMIRVPDSTGIYYKGTDGFINVPTINLTKENITKKSFGTNYIIGHTFYLPSDDVFKIQIDTIKPIEIFDRSNVKLFLIETDSKYVAKNVIPQSSIGFYKSIFGKQVKTDVDIIGLNVKVHRFSPEIGKKYVLISYKGTDYSQDMTSTAFAFEFLKK